jgi:peptidoglycan hydrolase-like protein with peptidoglycan-binding domain
VPAVSGKSERGSAGCDVSPVAIGKEQSAHMQMRLLRLLMPAALPALQLLAAGPLNANDPLVFRAQQKLTNLGYPVQRDGIYGRATRRAIREFQQDRGLPETGRLDRRTLEELGIDKPTSSPP